MNPMQMLKAKEYLERFERNHPRVMPFLKDAEGRITEGTIIEVKVTSPDGTGICSNIRITADDMEMLRELK